MWSRRMRSVLLRFGSNFSEEENAAMMNITSYCKTCMQYFATHIDLMIEKGITLQKQVVKKRKWETSPPNNQ